MTEYNCPEDLQLDMFSGVDKKDYDKIMKEKQSLEKRVKQLESLVDESHQMVFQLAEVIEYYREKFGDDEYYLATGEK